MLYEFTQDTFLKYNNSGRCKLFEPYQTERLVRLYTLPFSVILSFSFVFRRVLNIILIKGSSLIMLVMLFDPV